MGGKGCTWNSNCTWGTLGEWNVTSWVVAAMWRAFAPGFTNETLPMMALSEKVKPFGRDVAHQGPPSVKVISKASWPDIGCHGSCPRWGWVGSTRERCMAARAMMHMLSSMVSTLGTGWVKEHQRGVCGGQSDCAHAVKYGEYASVWWRG